MIPSAIDEYKEQLARDKLLKALYEADNLYCKYACSYSNVRNRKSFRYIFDYIRYDSMNQYPVLAAGGDGRISYARNPADKFCAVKKVRTSFSRYVRRVLKINDQVIPDADLEAFHLAFKFAIKSDGDLASQIQILNGSKLLDSYKNTMIVSCMTGEEKSKFIEFYAANPDRVSVVIVKDLVRALMWHTDKGDMLDVVYGPSFGYSILDTWFQKKERKVDRYNADRENIIIKMKATPYMPYMDTFPRGYYDKANETVYIASSARVLQHHGMKRNVSFTDSREGWFWTH